MSVLRSTRRIESLARTASVALLIVGATWQSSAFSQVALTPSRDKGAVKISSTVRPAFYSGLRLKGPFFVTADTTAKGREFFWRSTAPSALGTPSGRQGTPTRAAWLSGFQKSGAPKGAALLTQPRFTRGRTTVLGITPAAAINTVWTGGIGNWSNPAQWTNGVPNGNFNAFIDGGNAAASPVTLDIGASINNLVVNSNDSLGISNNLALTVNGTTLSNAGQLTINSFGNTTSLVIGGSNVTLSGGGTVTLSNNPQNFIFGTAGTNTLTNQETIQGAGTIGNNQLTLVNSSTINGNASNALNINPSGGTTNTGILEATGGGTLNLFGNVTNTGGTIQATGTGSTVAVESGATIIGGTLTTGTGGLVQSFGATFNGLTNAGTLQVPNNNTATLVGAINNTGAIQLNSFGNLTELIVGGSNVTLSGAGSLTLSNNSQNFIFGTVGSNVLTNQQTIQGAGSIGNNQLTLVNAGTIDANVSGFLNINPSGGTTNTAILEATSGGALNLFGNVTNTGGTIQATGAGSTVLVSGATINGGTLTTGSGGVIQSLGGTLNGLTTAGTLQVPNNNSATLVGTINNTGAIQLNSLGNATQLLASGTVTLTGAGTVTLFDNSQNFIWGGGGNALINQNNTISGSGNIGNGSMAFTNHGTVDATSVLGNHLIVQTGTAGTTNTATMEASSGGTLELQNSVTNTGGTIQALAGTGPSAGGTVLLNGANVTGGTVQALGTGVNAGVIVSTGATLNGLTTAGTVQVPNNNTLTLVGTINNTGALQLNSVGNVTQLLASGTVTLKGGGTLTLSDNSQNFVFGAAGTALVNQDNTISGSGNIGNSAMGFVNDAIVNATSAHGNHLIIKTAAAGATNLGTMEASSGGTLDIESIVNNTNGTTNGTIEALAGGVVLLKGATIRGGTLTSIGSGVISSAGSVLDGSAHTLNMPGRLNIPNNNSTSLRGTINDTGTISLLSTGNQTNLKIIGPSVTLQGGGKVILSDNTQNFIFGASTGTEQLINQITIQGAGNIGAGLLTLANQGTINANSATGKHLIIQPGTGGATNTATMEATGVGVLELENAITNTSGTITAAGTGSTVLMDLNATITGGTLNGAGTFISNGATLNGLTSAGLVQVPNNNTVTMAGTINNTGNIQLNSTGNATELLASGTLTLAGGGQVTLSDNSQNFIFGVAGSALVNQNNTISGSGNIGANVMSFTNQGTVNATSAGGNHLVIQAGGAGATNTATMEASSGGTLELQNTVNNTGGTITALAGTGPAAGGTVLLTGATVTGGLLRSLGTGVNAGTIVSNGGTLNGLTNAGAVQIPNNTTSFLTGTINNPGNISLNSAGNLTALKINGNVTLNGTGSVSMSDNPQNSIFGASTGSEVLTNASTIKGSGNIGAGFMGLVNSGTILANQSNPLIIHASSAGFNNTGTLQANSGSTLQVIGPFSNFSGTTLTGGKYVVGGTFQFDGANIVTNAANITLTGTSSQILNQSNINALTNFTTNAAAGRFTLAGNQNLTTATGTFTNSGIMAISSGSIFTVGNGGNTSTATNYTQTAGTTTVDGTLTASPTTAGTPTLNLQSGSLFGGGTVSDTVTSSGIISPGASWNAPGKLAVSGTFTQNSSGALDISIAGTTVGTQYDQLNVTGSSSLNGTLNIKLVNGFVPTVGTTFDILNTSVRSGTFSTVTGTAINGSEHFAITYNGNDVLLTVVAGPAASSTVSLARPSVSARGGGGFGSTGLIASNRSFPDLSGKSPIAGGADYLHSAGRLATRPVSSLSKLQTSPSTSLGFGGSHAKLAGFDLPSHGFATAMVPRNVSRAIQTRINPAGAAFPARHGRKSMEYHVNLGSILGMSPRSFLGDLSRQMRYQNGVNFVDLMLRESY